MAKAMNCPAYIGLSCSRDPTVPPATSWKNPNGMTWRSGTNASSTTTLCEPEPFRPMRSPQLSSRRNSGVTNAIVPPSSWMSPMWWVEYGIPGGEVPRAGDDPAAVDAAHGHVLRAEAQRSDELAADGAEDLVLRALLEVARELQRVPGRQAQLPAGRRAAARDGDHHLVERGEVDLQAPVPARDQQPVEAGLAEQLVRLGSEEGPLLGGGLLLEEQRAQCERPAEQLLPHRPGDHHRNPTPRRRAAPRSACRRRVGILAQQLGRADEVDRGRPHLARRSR